MFVRPVPEQRSERGFNDWLVNPVWLIPLLRRAEPFSLFYQFFLSILFPIMTSRTAMRHGQQWGEQKAFWENKGTLCVVVPRVFTGVRTHVRC